MHTSYFFMEAHSDVKVLLELIVLCIGVADCLEVGRDCYFWKQRYWSANELFFLPYNIKQRNSGKQIQMYKKVEYQKKKFKYEKLLRKVNELPLHVVSIIVLFLAMYHVHTSALFYTRTKIFLHNYTLIKIELHVIKYIFFYIMIKYIVINTCKFVKKQAYFCKDYE